jgi:hypothetical protein
VQGAAIAAFVACIYDDLRILVGAGFMAFFGIVPPVVGAIFDGAELEVVKSFRTCAAPPDPFHSGPFSCYGNPGICQNFSNICPQLAPYFDLSIPLNDDVVFPQVGSCYCSDGDVCTPVTLRFDTVKFRHYTCQNVMNLYGDELSASIFFCASLALLCAILSGLIFNSICCMGSAGCIEPPSVDVIQPPHRPLIINSSNGDNPESGGANANVNADGSAMKVDMNRANSVNARLSGLGSI